MYLGNSVKEPGHLDFGRSRLPDNTWLCIGTSVDRENFGDDIAHIVPFVNGFSDGPGTSIKMTGSLSSNASMTLGNGLDDVGNLIPGRRDRRFEEKPRFGQQFQVMITLNFVGNFKLSELNLISSDFKRSKST